MKKVICINTENSILVLGDIYLVKEETTDLYEVFNPHSHVSGWFYKTRFRNFRKEKLEKILKFIE